MADIPQYRLAYDYLEHYARTRPEAEAVVANGLRLTYRHLKSRVDACARALIAAGVAPGDRIAYLSPPHPDFVVLLLSTLAVGGIAVGINPRYRLREIAHILDDAGPSLFFSRVRVGPRSYTDDLAAAQASVPRLVTFGELPGPPDSVPLKQFVARQGSVARENLAERTGAVPAESPGLIVYTSGTTGAPKGVLLKQSAALRHGRMYLYRFRLAALRAINYYPTNHVSGLVASTLQTLVGGGTLVCMERFDAGEVLATIESERITLWGGTPTMLQMCVAHPDFESTDLSSVRILSCGGGGLRDELAAALSRRVPRLATLFAMTETTGGVTAVESDVSIDAVCNSIGRPLQDVEIRLVGEDGDAVDDGEVGELLVRGPSVMIGYWNNPVATAAAIDADGWLHTGDLARTNPDGCIRLAGRRIEMFKSGGYNVYPKEVEAVLESHAGVANAVVVGVADDLYGETGAAFVQAEPGERPPGEEALRAHCRRLLAGYKVPGRIEVAGALPMLPNGKFDRRRLTARAERARAAS